MLVHKCVKSVIKLMMVENTRSEVPRCCVELASTLCFCVVIMVMAWCALVDEDIEECVDKQRHALGVIILIDRA